MANRFYYRFDSLTLDPVHDHVHGSADNTATVNGGATLSTVDPIFGSSSGLFAPSSADQFRFDSSEDLINRLVGVIAGSIRFSALPSGAQGFVSVNGTDGNIALRISGGNLLVITNFEGVGESQVITTGGAISATDTRYSWAYRYDHANSLRSIEIYNAAGEIIDSVTSNAPFTAPANLVNSAGLRIGNTSGSDGAFRIDNIIIDDDYNAPVQNNFGIDSWTEWDAGAAVTVTSAGAAGVFRVNQIGGLVVGTGFGATQGGGSVRICPSNDINDANGVNQTVTAWADTEIAINVVLGTLAVNTPLYLFVTSDAGASNAAGFEVEILPSIGALAFGAGLLN